MGSLAKEDRTLYHPHGPRPSMSLPRSERQLYVLLLVGNTRCVLMIWDRFGHGARAVRDSAEGVGTALVYGTLNHTS